MIISLIGNDGSGKTTLADRLQEYFAGMSEKVIKPAEFEYFFIMKLIKKIIPQNNLSRQQENMQGHSAVSFSKKVFPYLVWIDLFVEYLFRKLVQKNKIIIKDRTPVDFLMTWQELGVLNSFIRFLYFFIPQADLQFYVNTNSEIAFSRRKEQKNKKEKSQNFYKKKKKMYDNFLMNKKGIMFVDNNSTIDNSFSKMIDSIELKNKFSKIKTIAISGLDGAGKTTTINNLTEALDELNIKYKVIHFYYNYSFLKIKRWFKKDKIVSEKESHKKSLETEKKAKELGKPKWWKWFVFADAYLQYFLVKIFYRNRLIIFDRFFPDYLVSFNFLGVKHDDERLLKSFPKVDRYFLQIADYKILHNRKPEHTIEFFQTCHTMYSNLAEEENMILLDSGKYNEKEIINELLKNI